MLNIVTNPIIVGLFFGVMTYLYLWWTIPEPKKSKKGKGKKNKKKSKDKPGFMIPAVVFAVTYFLAYCYNEYANKSSTTSGITENNKYSLKRDSPMIGGGSDDQRSFRMIQTGVSVPRGLSASRTNLPDIFINAI
jgi:hypothetical protein